MSEQPCVKCGGPCKASEPMTHGVYQRIAQNARDIERLAALRAHEDFAEWLEGLRDAVRHGGECSALLLQLLKGSP